MIVCVIDHRQEKGFINYDLLDNEDDSCSFACDNKITETQYLLSSQFAGK